ncbi:MAG: DUF5107 domain-containing protein [Sediminicola sp.]
MKILAHLIGTSILLFFCSGIMAQGVTIKEETLALDTYGFGKPDPVPILAENPKIYPYFKFDEYEHKAQKKDWKVITLENEYIKVMVLPEIGGKIWGAIDKTTGKEFLYKNEVIKFRNIAMRGPWTSGGIEFNFGIIGHHPATASPVDYRTRTNADGSVSCIVGSTDLPSNTKWTVEVKLESDRAFFETNVSWYNASPLSESYYNWMTAAAVATTDLEFIVPGNTYLGHNGDAHPWPVDESGRDLSFYRNNNFGPAKSYHIVGEYKDFFGGYYHDANFGFGHWAPYEEMPGQKVFLWALSRSGGIWEDLLTDSDGQYFEFQAGRLFNQYSPKGEANPIKLVGFDPYVMDRWQEIWFPYKEIGGMEDVSRDGVLNVEMDENGVYVGLNALTGLDKFVRIDINGRTVFRERKALSPLEVFSKTLPAKASDRITVSVEGTELSYSNQEDVIPLKRPFNTKDDLKISDSEKLYLEGTEASEYRNYGQSHEKLSRLIEIDPSHASGLVKLAELEYRRTDYDKALQHINTVLAMDTYNAAANYMAGITYRALNDTINALESLGWAARDIKYRSVSFAHMAELYLAAKDYERAKTYAQKALDFNTYNLNARKVLALTAREQLDRAGFKEQITLILEIDPLSLFAGIENRVINGLSPRIALGNEFPSESFLGLAEQYYQWGLPLEAVSILETANSGGVKIKLWQAYLQKDLDKKASMNLLKEISDSPVDFVFPYRRATLSILKWAADQNDSWKIKFYLAQNYFAVGRDEEGKSILEDLAYIPESDIFYRFRARILGDRDFDAISKDYEKALHLNPNDWKVREEMVQFYLRNHQYQKAYQLSKKSYGRFPKNYNIALVHAKALLNTNGYEEVLSILKNIQVLPYEQASESREIYERAHLAVARSYYGKGNFKKVVEVVKKSKEWPENIGVGKPYAPDEREQDYLLAMALQKVGENEESKAILNTIIAYTKDHINLNSLNHLYGLLALRKMGNADAENRLLAQLDEPTAINDKRSQLAVAFFTASRQKLEQLKSQNVVPKDAQEIASWLVNQ